MNVETPDVRAAVLAEVRSGVLTYDAIAERHLVHKRTVRRWAQQAGIAKRRITTEMPPERRARIAKMLRDGVPTSVIVQAMRASKNTVLKLARELKQEACCAAE
jgi:transposase